VAPEEEGSAAGAQDDAGEEEALLSVAAHLLICVGVVLLSVL
jgi:hypothetical protein